MYYGLFNLLKNIWLFSTFLAITYKTTVNIHIQVFMRTYVFIFLGWMLKSTIARLYGSCMFSSWRYCQTFPEAVPLHSPAMYESDPVSLNLNQHWMLSLGFILAFLIGVQLYLIVVLICIFLMTNYVEYIFMCLSGICMSS